MPKYFNHVLKPGYCELDTPFPQMKGLYKGLSAVAGETNVSSPPRSSNSMPMTLLGLYRILVSVVQCGVFRRRTRAIVTKIVL